MFKPTVVPRVPAPGATLKILAGGSIVNAEQFVLENATFAVVLPLIDTQLETACAAVRDTGILKLTVRLDPPTGGTTPVALTLTADPLPGAGVIVTETADGEIVPLG